MSAKKRIGKFRPIGIVQNGGGRHMYLNKPGLTLNNLVVSVRIEKLDYTSRMSTQNGPSTTGKETALAKQAKQASLVLGALSLTQRNEALQTIHSTLLSKHQEILNANKLDMQVSHQICCANIGGGGISCARSITRFHG